MKILFCAYDRPGHIATGPNAWLQRLIPDLISNYGLEVSTLFIYNGKVEDCPTMAFFDTNRLPTFKIDREQVPYVADQVKELLQIIKNNTIEILVANLVIPALYAARFLKPFHIPVIGVLHSNDPFYKGVIEKFIKGNQADELTSVVSVSTYIDGIAHSDTRDITNKIIPCGTPLTQNRSFRENNVLKIMYAGRLEINQKQILKLTHAFLNASKNNSDLEFSIYGSGSEEPQIKSLIAEFQHPHKVYFKGSVAPSEIQDVMSQHHVFTLMSDYEGMPIALMEAMACGLVPVCLYEESGIAEIIGNRVNGFIVDNREERYQEKLKLLQENQELWQDMSTQAIATIEQKFSSDITHKHWADLLHSFQDNAVKKIKIPSNIKLDGEMLYYGDNRKLSTQEVLTKQCLHNWLKLKMLIRPRARMRSLFKK